MRGNEPLRFLLVDDEPVALDLGTRLLKRIGFTDVDTASNGVVALAMMREAPYKAVISDWNMPEMSGLDLLRMVRTDAALRRTPFFMTSVDGAADRVKLAVLMGVSAFLLKPYDVHQLRAKLDEVLGSAHVPRLRAAA